MDKLQAGNYLAFHGPVVRSSVTLVADYATALTWGVCLLAYVSVGAFMAPVAVVLLLPAVVVTLTSWGIQRRTKVPAKHRRGPAHAR